MLGENGSIAFISISIYVAIILIIALVIVAFLRLNKKRDASVKSFGYYYNAVCRLNYEYQLLPSNNVFNITHYTKSKRTLDRLDLNDVVIGYIENNADGFRDFFLQYKGNKLLFQEYNSEYNRIIQSEHHYSKEELKETGFKKERDFISCETKMLSTIKKTFSEFAVYVNAYYTSPQGKKSYSKRAIYNYEQVLFCYNQWVNSKKYKVSSAYERSLMSDSLRYDILKRDGFKCCICGATAKDGATLHVDHIIPVSKGGKTVPSNLQTLCERCNLGKSNKL